MNKEYITFDHLIDAVLSVPVRIKIAGIMVLPILILGFSLNYWVQTGLSDWLSYLLSDERVRLAMTAGSRSVLFVSLLAAIASVMLSYVLIYVFTKPLMQVRQTAIRITRGRFDSRARVWAKDEIGELAQSINAMVDMLLKSQEKLKKANARLEAMNQVAMAAGRRLNLEEVLLSAKKEMLYVMGLNKGWVYIIDPQTQQFSPAMNNENNDSDPFFEKLSSNSNFSGQFVLMEGKLGKVELLQQYKRIEIWADNNSIFFHIIIPIEKQGQKFGFINLLCNQTELPGDEDLELLELISAQVSEIAANAWLHTRVVEKETARQALLGALVKAQEDERARLSRELHDGAGQMLTSLLVRLKALEKKSRGRESREDLSEMCSIVSETIERVREISSRYRPVSLEEFGLRVTLAMLIDDISAVSDIKIEFLYDLEDIKLSSEIEISIYRIIQECLTNVIRHADAKNVRVQINFKEGSFHICVADDGRGFNPDNIVSTDGAKHFGLLGIQERVEALAGRFNIISTPNDGTGIYASIPVDYG